MAHPVTFFWPPLNNIAVCLPQAVNEGNLLLNGEYVKNKNTEPTHPFLYLSGVSTTITLSSTENLSNVNFTIVGKSFNEDIVLKFPGPNIATITASRTFSEIYSISVDGTVPGGTVRVGIGSQGTTSWVPFNTLRGIFQASYSGTIIPSTSTNFTYQVDVSLEDVFTTLDAGIFGGSAPKTSSAIGQISGPVWGARFSVENSGASLFQDRAIFTILQQSV